MKLNFPDVKFERAVMLKFQTLLNMTPRLSGHFFYIWFSFLCAQVSSGNCETMESWKICNFVLEASESCQNFNISNEGYLRDRRTRKEKRILRRSRVLSRLASLASSTFFFFFSTSDMHQLRENRPHHCKENLWAFAWSGASLCLQI